jgi:hypothetical protein
MYFRVGKVRIPADRPAIDVRAEQRLSVGMLSVVLKLMV